MRRWAAYLYIIGATAFLWLSSSAWAAEPFYLKPFEAHYSVYGLSLVKLGELQQRFYRKSDNTYVLETVAFTTGMTAWFVSDRTEEQSVMRVTDGSVQPLLYAYHYTGRNKDVVERIDFDWAKGEVRSLRDGKITVLPLSKGLLDKQIYQLLARRDLAQGMTSMSYQVAYRSSLKTYELKVLGKEDIETPFGTFKSLKVQQGATTLWCAPDLGYAIVKLAREEGGHTLTSYITSLKPR